MGEQFSFNTGGNVRTFWTTVSLRYWYNLKKLIDEGRSANNLSSGYFSISGEHYLISKGVRYKENATSGLNNSILLSASIGYQKEIGRWGFLDLGIGPGWHTKLTGIQLMGYVKLGLRL